MGDLLAPMVDIMGGKPARISWTALIIDLKLEKLSEDLHLLLPEFIAMARELKGLAL